MPASIYLHWAATRYTIDLPSHTWRRNSNSIAISCACMGGRPDPWSLPAAHNRPAGGDVR